MARTPTVTPTPIAILVVLSSPPSLTFCEPAGDDVADEDYVQWGDFDEYTDELIEIDTKDLYTHVDEVKAQHSKLLKDHKYTTKSIQ